MINKIKDFQIFNFYYKIYLVFKIFKCHKINQIHPLIIKVFLKNNRNTKQFFYKKLHFLFKLLN